MRAAGRERPAQARQRRARLAAAGAALGQGDRDLARALTRYSCANCSTCARVRAVEIAAAHLGKHFEAGVALLEFDRMPDAIILGPIELVDDAIRAGTGGERRGQRQQRDEFPFCGERPAGFSPKGAKVRHDVSVSIVALAGKLGSGASREGAPGAAQSWMKPTRPFR